MSSKISLTPKQQEAVDSLHHNCIVSAGAGSGKTRVLVERYLKILADHHLDPNLLDQVVAITFTEKAATEMKERIRQGIKQRWQMARDKAKWEEADKWYLLSTELERAHITTIHSFCRRILQRYPVEAGLDPEFTVLEEFDARWMLKQAAQEALSTYLQSNQSHSKKIELLERWLVGVGVKSAQSQLMSVVLQLFTFGWSADDLRRVTFNHVQQLETEWQMKWESEFAVWEMQLLQAADELLQVKKIKKADEFRRNWSDLRQRWKETQTIAERLQLLVALEQALGSNWGRKEEVKQALEKSREARAKLLDLMETRLYFPDEKELLQVFSELIAEIVERYQQEKTEHAGVDFDEMQWRVCLLLEQYPEIQAELRERIRYLMVDEYQDTNDLQKKLIDLIVKDSTPGKLFVVGDPKQSIYRFRGADVSLFHRTRQEILADKGKEVALTANFRSHPELISFFNHFFSRLMSSDPDSPNYYQEVKAREDDSKPDVVLEYLAVPHQKDELPEGWDRRDAEARMIAQHIVKLMKEGTPAKDIAILFRAMTHVKKYERELSRLGIPFHVVKGRGFYHRQEVQDLLHFLRLLVDPENRLALIGVLRSPFCGVTDETILRISFDGAWQASVYEWSELAGLSEAEQRKIQRFARLWERAGSWVGAIPVAELMERLLTESGYRQIAWAGPDGKQVAANLKKLIQQAAAMSGLESFSVLNYLERVDLLISEQQIETEASVESEESDSVKLMTIHQSKGLEFPTVFVPDLSYSHTARSGAIGVDAKAGLVVIIKDEAGENIELKRWKQAKERNRQLEWEESVRLLYVATTRAEERLVLSGAIEPLKEENTIQDVNKWSQWVDGILHYDQIDWQEQKWVFDETCLPIRISAELQADEAGSRQSEVPLDAYLQGKMAPSADQMTEEEIQFLLPRGYTEHDLLEISVTDWKGLINCPRRHFYQHVLGLPDCKEEPPAWEERENLAVFSPKEKGTAVHRFIELLSSPENRTKSWTQLSEMVWDEQMIPHHKRDQAKEEISPYIHHFLESRIYTELLMSDGKPKTEQEFTVNMEGYQIIGVIDLLHRQPDGNWEIIDYKTDNITPADVEETAEDYVPQIQLYALAAEQKWGITPNKATLYFLKPNLEKSFTIDEAWMNQARNRLTESVKWMRASSPVQPWQAKPGKRCHYCPYDWICDAAEV